MTEKKYFIRCNSGLKIGIGHVMRCFSLAETLTDMKCKVNFICEELEGNIIHFLKEKNFEVLSIKNDNDVKQILKDNSNSSLIIDDYNIDEKFETIVRPYVKQIIVIDDLANRKHNCDLLLDQNFSGKNIDKYNNFIPKNCVRLFGPRFALLRNEFLENRRVRNINFPVKNIFISYGGVDSTDETTKVLVAIKNLKNNNLKVNAIIGDSNIQREKIRDLCSLIPNVNFISKFDGISKIMNESDLAFGAKNSSMWERMCLGVPSIVTITSEDQINATEALSENQYIINIGLAENVSSKDYERILNEISEKELNEISKKSYELVDGKGTKRSAEQIICLENS